MTNKCDRPGPQPQQWQALYKLLPNKQRKGGGYDPAVPLILAAWLDTPAIQKILRLREHIEWAAAHNCLNEVHVFLCGLPENQWHHIGE